MASTISLHESPFPVLELGEDGAIRSANLAWHALGLSSGSAFDALGLVASDHHDFVDAVTEVADDRQSQWLDVDVPIFDERRWTRCHLWAAPDSDSVIAALVPLRETRDIGLSRLDIEHIERILEHTADAITIVGEDLNFRFASGIATRWLGLSGTAYEGQQALGPVFADDHHILLKAFTTCINNPRLSVKARFRVVHESGDLIWVEGIGTNMFDDPAIQGILVTLNDITELVETRASAEANRVALETEKRRYETLAQFIPTGVFELNADDQLTYRNERFDELMQSDGSTMFTWDVFDHRDQDEVQRALAATRAGATTEVTVRLAKPSADGTQRWLTFRAASQDDGRVLASVDDATSQIAKEAELAHRADHDDLTGLPNRESLLEQLDDFTGAGEDIAVLFLDLDNFKDINDGLGHQVGDEVLMEVADRIRSVVRPDDIVGRLHGDEFLIVCRHATELRTAREIAGRVVASVSAPLESASLGLIVSGSIGIAMSNAPGNEDTTPEQLLAAADLAMYEAKRRGGARSVPFNVDLEKRATDRLRLHGDIQRASGANQLELHYQPIVRLATGEPESSEALIRWHHPTQGFILPERFIPEIEKSELIDGLGRWVLQQVVEDLSTNRNRSLPVNVNVSPRQLADEDFAEWTLGLLHSHEIDGSMLTIEITELVMMDDFAPVERQLHLLRDNGVRIAVDDFGTGYSSLAYLQRFPFDQIKIDGGFVTHVDTNEGDRAIVSSIVGLATSFGAAVIAEKVERASQVDVLIELGCTFAQGYLLGKPTPLGGSVQLSAPRDSVGSSNTISGTS